VYVRLGLSQNTAAPKSEGIN